MFSPWDCAELMATAIRMHTQTRTEAAMQAMDASLLSAVSAFFHLIMTQKASSRQSNTQ